MLAAKYELWIPRILGTEFRTLGLRLGLDAAMFGVGGLMGIRVATSVILGTAVNFLVLAPIMIARGDIAPRIGPTGATVALSRAEIVNQWSLWWGVTMMVVGSLIALVGKPEIFTSLFKNLRGKKKSETRQGHPGGNRAAALDFVRRRPNPLPVGGLAHPSLFRRADRARAALAAARHCSDRHLRELDGADVLDADQFAERRSPNSPSARSTAPIPPRTSSPAA